VSYLMLMITVLFNNLEHLRLTR